MPSLAAYSYMFLRTTTGSNFALLNGNLSSAQAHIAIDRKFRKRNDSKRGKLADKSNTHLRVSHPSHVKCLMAIHVLTVKDKDKCLKKIKKCFQ